MSEEIFLNDQLRRARSLKGWSQERLAEEVGTVATVVSRWERGVNVPNPYFRERLCAVLGKTPEELGLARDTQKPFPPPDSSLVFLVSSHDDVDHAIIPPLQVLLQDRGITLWSHRQFSRQGAENPQKALREGIRTAQVLLVIVSPLARTSRHVREALEAAKMYGRPVYGVWIGGSSGKRACPATRGRCAP
jgi:transcriptional regulator with XRE-family HTH domain